MTQRFSRGGSAAAFSLFELIIALALITITSVIAIPLFYAQPGITLDNAAILLARDLRYAQNSAVVIRGETQVVVDANGDGYRVCRISGQPLPNPVGDGPLVRTYSADAIFEGIDIPRVEGAPQRTISFAPTGHCLTAAQVELRYAGRVRILRLEKGTGEITIDGLLTTWCDDGL
jgi:type II secretory pathway pseudopilin PulG